MLMSPRPRKSPVDLRKEAVNPARIKTARPDSPI